MCGCVDSRVCGWVCMCGYQCVVARCLCVYVFGEQSSDVCMCG